MSVTMVMKMRKAPAPMTAKGNLLAFDSDAIVMPSSPLLHNRRAPISLNSQHSGESKNTFV